MRDTLFVGLDVGTSTSKAVVFTADGEPVASGRATTPWTVTTSGAELDAKASLDAAKSAVAEAMADCPPAAIGGLGVASFAESGVLLDQHGDPVAPVIAWHDTRDHAELAGLTQTVGARNFSATTGLPLRQQWSLTKHRWLRRHPPKVTWPGGQFASGRYAGDAGALVGTVATAHADAAQSARPRERGAPYGSDLRLYAGAGIPTLHYGPGDGRLAHSPDESVAVSEVVTVTEALVLTILRTCR